MKSVLVLLAAVCLFQVTPIKAMRDESETTTTTTDAVRDVVETTSTTTTVVAVVNAGTYRGCYNMKESALSKGKVTLAFPFATAVEQCNKACGKMKTPYFALRKTKLKSKRNTKCYCTRNDSSQWGPKSKKPKACPKNIGSGGASFSKKFTNRNFGFYNTTGY